MRVVFMGVYVRIYDLRGIPSNIATRLLTLSPSEALKVHSGPPSPSYLFPGFAYP